MSDNLSSCETVKYFCKDCDYTTSRHSNLKSHFLTAKHINKHNSAVKTSTSFRCEICDYTTERQYNLNTHFLTEKHKCQALAKSNKKEIVVKQATSVYDCSICNVCCGNESTLKRHELTKAHQRNMEILQSAKEPSKEAIIIENAELKKMMLQLFEHSALALSAAIESSNKLSECAEKIGNQPANVSYTQNNSFNINMFLNETCKNAKNMSEFIDSIVITHEDLINNGELGFVGGMIKILTDNLNKLDITERPLHCTDLKRETIYIKDDGIWSKENSEEKINRGIQRISNRNVQELLKWKRSNPDYADINSEFSDLCHKIHCTVMAGDERVVLFPRVAKGIAKFVLLDKQQFMN